MKIKVEIDPDAGFCHGVVKAISKAESELFQNHELLCLGDIVHNSEEVSRLNKLGLISIQKEDLKKIKNKKVLLRAHGEPPETYLLAKENNITVIDATCPVVLGLQKKVKEGYNEMKKCEGQIAIFGKEGHAEVIGLLGQTNNEAILIRDMNDISIIDFSKPLLLFSQTTRELSEYIMVQKEIISKYKQNNLDPDKYFKAYKTICNHVVKRKPNLTEFCRNHDLIVFVSGTKSSNGKALFITCKNSNNKAYFVSTVDEVERNWFTGIKTVGISGATSTPKWLMEKIKQKIESFK